MKILFINPSVDAEEEDHIWASSLKHNLFGNMSFIPRQAPMIIAAVTPPEHSFTYQDEDLEKISFDPPNFDTDTDLIAFTGLTAQAERGYYLADEFRRRGYPVVIGGIHASSSPDDAAAHADAVCIGEGENTWPVLLEDFENNRLKDRYSAKDYPPVEKLVSPRIDIIKQDSYSVYALQATKGCPYSCDFCCIAFSSGHKYRTKPVEQVIEEIKEYERLYNTGPLKKRYHFVDDNLYVNREYTVKLFTALAELNVQWMGMGSLNILKDDEVVRLMADSGCRSFGVGFESISEDSLKEANKNFNSVEEYGRAAETLIKHGIIPVGYFIFGFDSDDEGIFRRTTEFIVKNHIINPYFQILTPFPGTGVYERVKDRIYDWSWRHYGSLKCVFKPSKIEPEQLEAGSYGASWDSAQLDLLKSHMKYFWAHGPWKKNPRLNFADRFLLMVLASRLRGKEKKEYRKFLYWAATRRNAVDPYQIVSTVTFNDMAIKFDNDRKAIKAKAQKKEFDNDREAVANT